nr:hypothetical protein [uncultured Flavobacterium sp.]
MPELERIIFYHNRELEHSRFYEARKYGYMYQDFENEKLIKELHYEVEINCEISDTSNDFIFEINRKQIYINQQEPDLLP